MKWINKLNEPECLNELRKITSDYNDLSGDCKKKVINQLKIESKNSCVYCEKNIDSYVFIEHYHSQEENEDLKLDYNNFLAVCSGKYYLDKSQGTHYEHCGNSKKSKNITIDPRNQKHIETLNFDEYDRLISSNTIFQNDIDTILNLNIEGICNERMKAFDNISILINSLNDLFPNRENFIDHLIKTLDKEKPNYYSYIKMQVLKHFNH